LAVFLYLAGIGSNETLHCLTFSPALDIRRVFLSLYPITFSPILSERGPIAQAVGPYCFNNQNKYLKIVARIKKVVYLCFNKTNKAMKYARISQGSKKIHRSACPYYWPDDFKVGMTLQFGSRSYVVDEIRETEQCIYVSCHRSIN
jgi:hypothetical protein